MQTGRRSFPIDSRGFTFFGLIEPLSTLIPLQARPHLDGIGTLQVPRAAVALVKAQKTEDFRRHLLVFFRLASEKGSFARTEVAGLTSQLPLHSMQSDQ